MSIKKILILFFMFINFTDLMAQSNGTSMIRFFSQYDQTKFTLSDSYNIIGKNDSVQFTVIKFYISKLEFLNNNQLVGKEENSFHLIDLSNDSSSKITYSLPPEISFNKIRFNLGIDSLTNVSGVMGGDLDPTNGMYWTWQSGYINFKLEGKSSSCNTHNNEFVFHLGGYAKPYNALRTIELKVENTEIFIKLDLQQFLNSIDLSNNNHIMSPGRAAVDLSNIISNLFVAQ